MFREIPVCVKSVQVDGGGEFRGEFEGVAENLGVTTYVLLARKPGRGDGGALKQNVKRCVL